MILDPYYQVFYRESEGSEWRYWENCYSYADAEAGVIAVFKKEKAIEAEVFEIVAEQRKTVFSAYRDKSGYIYRHREDEKRQMQQEQEEQQEQAERQKRQQQEQQRQQEEEEQQKMDTGYGFGF